MLRAAPTFDTTPLRSLEEPPVPNNPVAECLRSAAYAAAADPLVAVAQISDNYAGTRLTPTVRFAFSAIGVNQPAPAEFGSASWFGQQLGGAAGMMVPFMLTRGRIAAATPALFGQSALKLAAERSLLSFAAREAALSGTAGLAYGTVLRSSESSGAESFAETRFKNGLADMAVFGTLGFTNPILGRVFGGPVSAGIASGVPGGVVGAEVNAWRNGNPFASALELKESIASNLFVGGAFGGAQRFVAARAPVERASRSEVIETKPALEVAPPLDRATALFADVARNYGVVPLDAPPPLSGVVKHRTLPTGDRVGDHIFGLTVVQAADAGTAWLWKDAGITVFHDGSPTTVITTKNGSRISRTTNKDDTGTFTVYAVEETAPGDQIRLRPYESAPRSNHARIKSDRGIVDLGSDIWLRLSKSESVAISFDTRQRIIRTDGTRITETLAQPQYQSIHYADNTSEHRFLSGKREERSDAGVREFRDADNASLFERTNIPIEPYDFLADRTANIAEVRHTRRAIRLTESKRLTEVDVREYILEGLDTIIVVPEKYARRLDLLRQARQRGEPVPAAWQTRLLPEQMVDGLKTLPGPNIVKEMHMLPGLKDSEAFAGRDGIIRISKGGAEAWNWFPIYEMNGETKVSPGHRATLPQHEWAHLSEDWFGNPKLFDLAMEAEPVPYYARDYGKKNRHENMAVHMGEKFLHPDADQFMNFVHLAPMRAVVFSEMLQRLRKENGTLGPYDAQLRERIDYVQQNFMPPLMDELRQLPTTHPPASTTPFTPRELFLSGLLGELTREQPLDNPAPL